MLLRVQLAQPCFDRGDVLFKLVEDKSEESFAAFIAWLDKFSAQENIEFVLSCSADPEKAPESVKPLLI